MKSVILNKGLNSYTYMCAITEPIREEFIQYNWLITDYECNHYPDSRIRFDEEYVWMSGEEFLDLVGQHHIQFIWAVFSGFSKDIGLEDVLQYELPYADGNAGFWHGASEIQHLLACMEIVPWDSGLVLLMSKEAKVIDKFTAKYPQTMDLEQYNNDYESIRLWGTDNGKSS